MRSTAGSVPPGVCHSIPIQAGNATRIEYFVFVSSAAWSRVPALGSHNWRKRHVSSQRRPLARAQPGTETPPGPLLLGIQDWPWSWSWPWHGVNYLQSERVDTGLVLILRRGPVRPQLSVWQNSSVINFLLEPVSY